VLQFSYQAHLPINRLPMAEEAAAGTILRKGRRPDDAPCAFLHRQFRIRTAHFGAHPAWTNSVDLDAGAEQFSARILVTALSAVLESRYPGQQPFLRVGFDRRPSRR